MKLHDIFINKKCIFFASCLNCDLTGVFLHRRSKWSSKTR